MLKLSILFFLLFSTLFASTLQRAETFAKAQSLAQKQGKRIMVLITQSDCRYCKRMKETTFSDVEVIERIEKNYVFVEVDRYFDEYPEDLTVYGVPTTYFLYSDGTHIMRGAGGFWDKIDFLSFMDDADNKVKKKQKNKQ